MNFRTWFTNIRRWFRLLIRHRPGGIYYINGADVLPQPLEAEAEAEAVRQMEEGSEEARGALIEHNLRLVVYIAKKYESSGVGIEDLISIGTLGLIKAINTFRSDKNIKLATIKVLLLIMRLIAL